MSDSSRGDLLDILEAVSKAQLRAIRKLRGESKAENEAPEQPRKSMSHVDMVHNILVRAGRPMHISEILDGISKQFGVDLDRESVVSALAKRVARKDRFLRTVPNTYALLPER